MSDPADVTPADATLVDRPVELLRALLRFDTTNPPGNERDCIAWIARLLAECGIASETLAREPSRPNLIARVPGRGEAPPLLLYGHVDVVTTADQSWTHPPFEAVVDQGYVWGRGTLDMKGAVAMMIGALARVGRADTPPPGDVILAVLSDEEAGGDLGARFLVEEHAGRFEGVRHALGEFGGVTMHLAGRRLYPIQVAEKQMCWLRATVEGPAGHASRVMRGGAAARLGALLQTLDRLRLPIHVTDVSRRRIRAMASVAPVHLKPLFHALLVPRLADRALRLLGPGGQAIEPWLRHTLNATIVSGGEKINVIPSRLDVEIDGRLLPGFSADDLIAEVAPHLPSGVTLEVTRFDPGPPSPDWHYFETLSDILREADPGAVPMPMLLPAFTDGRFFARLGIQTYGFTPMKLPPGLNLFETIHAADERIPVDAVAFGTRAMIEAIERYRA